MLPYPYASGFPAYPRPYTDPQVRVPGFAPFVSSHVDQGLPGLIKKQTQLLEALRHKKDRLIKDLQDDGLLEPDLRSEMKGRERNNRNRRTRNQEDDSDNAQSYFEKIDEKIERQNRLIEKLMGEQRERFDDRKKIGTRQSTRGSRGDYDDEPDPSNPHLKLKKKTNKNFSHYSNVFPSNLTVKPGRATLDAVFFYSCLVVQHRKKYGLHELSLESDIQPGMAVVADFIKKITRESIQKILYEQENIQFHGSISQDSGQKLRSSEIKTKVTKLMQFVEGLLTPLDKDIRKQDIPPAIVDFMNSYTQGNVLVPEEYIYPTEKIMRDYAITHKMKSLPKLSQRIIVMNVVFVRIIIMKFLYSPSIEGFGSAGDIQTNNLAVLRTILYRIIRHAAVPFFDKQIDGDEPVYATLLPDRTEHIYVKYLDFSWCRRQSETVFNITTHFLRQISAVGKSS